MKVAVCFSGQARYIKENFQQLKDNIIDPFGADVFCHFWKRGIADTCGREPHLGYQYFNASKVEKLYQPVEFLIEENPDPLIFRLTDKFLEETLKDTFPKEFWFERGQTFRVLSQYLSVLKSIDLKKKYEQDNNFIYDHVIRARSDFVLPRPLTKEDLPADDIITILRSPHEKVKEVPNSGGILSDSFAIGRSKHMDLYCDTFNSLTEAVASRIKLTGEGFSAVNARKHGLEFRYSDIIHYQSFYTPKEI